VGGLPADQVDDTGQIPVVAVAEVEYERHLRSSLFGDGLRNDGHHHR
jgi:hypothetical protein